jgi:50S ribosomal protein L16 3-hydroxylase
MNKSLESIIKPMKRDVFLDKYLKNEPVITHGIFDQSPELSELNSLPLLKSFDSLMKTWPALITAYLPGIADEGNSKKVSTLEARELFQKGSGLCFDDANQFCETLDQWPQIISSDLGLSALTQSRSLIYAIRKGKGTAPHFDQNINFVLQISGIKKWWIAPNTHVENPLSRHTIGIDTDPELASYSGKMPDQFPEDSTEYTLEPGSMLFVPRGSWHKTEAISDAISLNFTFTAPSWIDIFTTALRGRLAQSSSWRETANFVSDEKRHIDAVDNFDMLLAELVHDIPNWRAADILGATEYKS